jgi:hypothetical protein
LIKPDDPRMARRARLAVLVGWAPLDAAIASTHRLLDSKLAELIVVGVRLRAGFDFDAPHPAGPVPGLAKLLNVVVLRFGKVLCIDVDAWKPGSIAELGCSAAVIGH